MKRSKALTAWLTGAGLWVGCLTVAAQSLPFTEVNQVVTGACQKDSCANLTVRTAEFSDYPVFSHSLTRMLLAMAQNDSGRPTGLATVAELTSTFTANATPRTSEVLQANVLRSQRDLVVVDLVHYLYAGGAHGDTRSKYVNWFVQLDQLMTLDDMLQPGARPAFERVLKQAYLDWLAAQSAAIGDRDTFHQIWPFKVSDNVALLDDGLRVTYERYQIAPGSFGQPSLVIPYSKLVDILQPRVLSVAS